MTTPTPTQQLEEVLAFLDGTGELRGMSFGEIPDGERGKYWWRKHLKELAPTLRRALAALEAVEGAEDCECGDCNGDGVWHLEPCGFCDGHGNFKMVPAPKTADAVEVSRG